MHLPLNQSILQTSDHFIFCDFECRRQCVILQYPVIVTGLKYRSSSCFYSLFFLVFFSFFLLDFLLAGLSVAIPQIFQNVTRIRSLSSSLPPTTVQFHSFHEWRKFNNEMEWNHRINEIQRIPDRSRCTNGNNGGFKTFFTFFTCITLYWCDSYYSNSLVSIQSIIKMLLLLVCKVCRKS